ncbi:hypothetical protein SDC9_191083 [bioreactor metagenome]|uniref:Uncharacterized protein n=1 Tax=bioreactor metagenome TaxID=1076179 RepID=A0A645I7X3_9ZZZZ
MFTVAGLNDCIKGLSIAHHCIHDTDCGKIALKIPLDRFGAKTRGQRDYLCSRRSNFPSLHANRMGHRLGGVHVHDQNAHDFQLSFSVFGGGYGNGFAILVFVGETFRCKHPIEQGAQSGCDEPGELGQRLQRRQECKEQREQG